MRLWLIWIIDNYWIDCRVIMSTSLISPDKTQQIRASKRVAQCRNWEKFPICFLHFVPLFQGSSLEWFNIKIASSSLGRWQNVFCEKMTVNSHEPLLCSGRKKPLYDIPWPRGSRCVRESSRNRWHTWAEPWSRTRNVWGNIVSSDFIKRWFM